MSAPGPIRVQLMEHDPAWAEIALAEARRIGDAMGDVFITVHHIGSTAISGIRAKPIIDLLAVARNSVDLDEGKENLERLGYIWWGEFGLSERRYCTLTDLNGRRLVQLHCYAMGSFEVDRHLAFRDYLRARPDLAKEYEVEKMRCAKMHPGDSHAYTDCKSSWVKRVEEEAMKNMEH